MKKFVSGLVAGIILATSFTAFADSILGKQVDGSFPLKINGQRAPKDVITIEGVSYLPVRAAGDMFGYKVDFVDWEVTLDSAATTPEPPLPPADDNKEPPTYISKSSIQEISSGEQVQFLTRGGEQYVSVRAFGKVATLSNSSYTIELFGTKVEIPFQQAYQPGINGFEYYSRNFVKLSLFGLTATPNGNELTIEKK